MVQHNTTVHDEFELNGHQGYTVLNESTGRMSLCCATCTGKPGGALLLDEWCPDRRAVNALAWVQHADPLNHPQAGQRYRWQGLMYAVSKVSERYRWADIRVAGPDGWSKRQPLPLPAGSVRVTGDA